MKEKTKEFIMKILAAISFGCLIAVGLLLFVGVVIPEAGLIGVWCFYTMIISVVILFVLMFAWGGLKLKPVDAERVTLNLKNEEELEKLIEDKLSDNKKVILENNNATKFILYTKKDRKSIECLIYMKVETVKRTAIQEMELQAIQKMTEDYHLIGRVYEVKIIELISTDKMTPDFDKMVNNNIVQDYKMYHLPCGVTWDSNTLYMAKQDDGFFVSEYKRLRKRLMQILEIDPKTMIKK